MKKIIPLLMVAAITGCCLATYAQRDSLYSDTPMFTNPPDMPQYLDLGRIKLNKEFTQTVTIKGSDLQQMPFTDLTEAINVWLHGVYSNTDNIVYVVDGNLINDVNAWSIYDIESITLVQNALVQLNGATNQQQLVLIKTKTDYPGKKGISVSGQSFLVKRKKDDDDPPGSNPATNLYHQYHATAYRNGEKTQMRLSAGYLRDVLPTLKSQGFSIKTPNNFDRFRLNGSISTQIGSWNTLNVQLNYAPQLADWESEVTFSGFYATAQQKRRQHLLNPTLQLQSRFSDKWLNELNISYLTAREREQLDEQVVSSSTTIEEERIKDKTRELLIRNRISYHHFNGKWGIMPSLDFMFRTFKSNHDYYFLRLNNNQPQSLTIFSSQLKNEAFLLTPAVNLYHNKQFNIQGGAMVNFSKSYGRSINRAFPFASLSFDILQTVQPHRSASLKIFGSYTKAGDFGDRSFRQQDFNKGLIFMRSPSPGGPVLPTLPPEKPDMWNFQTGVVYSSARNRWSVSYNFDRRLYLDYLIVNIPPGTGFDYRQVWPSFHAALHRFSIMAKMTESERFYWQSALQVTSSKTTIKKIDIGGGTTIESLEYDPSWSGGWTNRLRYRQFSFGFDLLYYLHETRFTGTAPPTQEKVNSWLLQNIYAGYSFRLANKHQAEIFADCRNLAESKKSELTDDRKYYGAGFKIML